MLSPERKTALAEARQKAKQGASRLPKCTRTLPATPARGEAPARPPRPCGTRTIQNAPERTRGVYWCPRCRRYSFGSGGGRAGGGPDKVPAEAYA